MFTKQPLIQFIQAETQYPVLLLACQDEGVLEVVSKHYKQLFGKEFNHQFILASDTEFNWAAFASRYTMPGLWSQEKTLFHVHLTTAQLPAECAKAMTAIAALKEHRILFSLNKEPASLPKTHWNDILDKPKQQALSFWMPFSNQMPLWCQIRAKANQCQLTPDAAILLGQYYENNLFALEQLLTRLPLTTKDALIDTKCLKSDTDVKTKGNQFSMIVAAFAGDSQSTSELLRGTQLKSTDLLSLLGIMVSQLQKAIAIQAHLNMGKTLKEATRGSFWQFHQPALTSMLKRHKPMTIMKILHVAPTVDRMVKQGLCDAAWHLLRQSIYAILKTEDVKSLEAIPFTDY